MPRGRMNKEKLCNKRKITIESSTQTEPFTKFWYPSVVLERLDLNEPEAMKRANKNAAEIQNSIISIQRRPSQISRAPLSYKNFVKPITNNKIANSTTENLSISDGSQEQNLNNYAIRRRNSAQITQTHLKPGPLSFKLRALQNLKDDMNVPVMLGEPSTSHGGRRSRDLDTISEKSVENSAIPDLELNVDLGSVHELSLIAEETQPDAILSDAQEKLDQTSAVGDKTSNCIPQAPIPEQPRRVHMEFKGVTTVISQDSRDDESTSSNEENEDVEWNKHTKFVKIKAQTVHIHNHFYKP